MKYLMENHQKTFLQTFFHPKLMIFYFSLFTIKEGLSAVFIPCEQISQSDVATQHLSFFNLISGMLRSYSGRYKLKTFRDNDRLIIRVWLNHKPIRTLLIYSTSLIFLCSYCMYVYERYEAV